MAVQPFRQRNRHKTRWVAALALGAGLALFAAVGAFGWINDVPWRKSLVEGVASTLMVSMVLGLLWDFWGRKDFRDEIFEVTKLKYEVQRSGLHRIGAWGDLDLNWKDLLRDTAKVDLFFNYSQSWRHTNLDLLRRIAKTKGTELNIYLLDPDDEHALSMTAARFEGYKTEDIRSRINEAHRDFSALTVDGGARIKIFKHPGVQLYGLYLTANHAVVTFHKHGKPRSNRVPTLVFGEGPAHEFFENEIKEIRANSKEWVAE